LLWQPGWDDILFAVWSARWTDNVWWYPGRHGEHAEGSVAD